MFQKKHIDQLIVSRENKDNEYTQAKLQIAKSKYILPVTHFIRKHLPPVATTSWGTLKILNR